MNKKDKEILDLSLGETKEYKRFNEIFTKIEKKKKKKRIIIIIFSVIALFIILFLIYTYYTHFSNRTIEISNIEVNNYDNKTLVLEIKPTTKEEYCAYSKSINGKLEFNKMINNKCIINTSLDSFYIYFKNNKNIISKEYLIDDYLVNLNFKDTYYLALNSSKDLNNNIIKYGNIDLTYNIENDIIEIENNIINTLSKGETLVEVFYKNEKVKEFNVVVTDVIVNSPKNFNTKKKYLSCEVFTDEEANLLDTILEDRINEVGINTRAAVVEAARFLMLEFPYRINYFFENGRLDVSGVNYVDGEGRYYHKGLYLSKDKEKNMKYTYAGPAMWGCPLTNYEDTSLFTKYKKYPNGLDCSGFVSWTLVNGGFDPGDLGAGNSELDPRELSDLGEYEKITDELIKSNKIKVGDLLNIWGHIAILVGIDDNNFYVAESLDIYGGVVIKTYSKDKITDTFPYVVLMDNYYKEDGKLTNMWY